MYIPRPAKLLFQIDNGWERFLMKHGDSVSEWTKSVVERMLACGTGAMGIRRYCCSSPDCSHSRYFCQSCKSKGCSACDMKATEQWIAEQLHILPDCDWQHITFTMPHYLWPFFNQNGSLLNRLFACATRALLRWARKQGIEIGIFAALHTYGRRLNQNPHIHLSVTRGGLCLKEGVWRDIFFKKEKVEAIWRQAVIRLLRQHYDVLAQTAATTGIRDFREWCQFLQTQYQRYWKVHFAHKTEGATRNTKYIGRYLKRPPIAAARLRHYSGGAVVHTYYDHHTNTYSRQTLSQEEMIGRYISHIPERHFKMVRYYGFLANRKRGALLQKVYAALEIAVPEKPQKPGYASLMKGFTGVDPYQCILCGSRLRFTGAEAGIKTATLLADRQQNVIKKRTIMQSLQGRSA